jgi:hypothetical protein
MSGLSLPEGQTYVTNQGAMFAKRYVCKALFCQQNTVNYLCLQQYAHLIHESSKAEGVILASQSGPS